MAVSCTIDGRLVQVAFTQATGQREIYDFFFRLSKDEDCPERADILIDTLQSTSRDSRTMETLEGIAKFIFLALPRPHFDRAAVVIPEDAIERYRTLTDEVSEKTGVEVRPYSDADLARAWLAEPI